MDCIQGCKGNCGVVVILFSSESENSLRSGEALYDWKRTKVENAKIELQASQPHLNLWENSSMVLFEVLAI